jgi:hypothetical protein
VRAVSHDGYVTVEIDGPEVHVLHSALHAYGEHEVAHALAGRSQQQVADPPEADSEHPRANHAAAHFGLGRPIN